MHSLKKLCFAVIGALVSCVLATGNDNMKDQGSLSDGNGPLWFGPRLGKRSFSQASEDNRQSFFKILEAADTLNYYPDQLPYFQGQASEPENRAMRKVLFTPKLGRHISPYEEKMIENADLISRLGRRLPNDMPSTPTDQDIYHSDAQQVDSRTNYYSPRLGRIMSFSPRLGRELAYETFPEKLRTVRSINKTQAN